ncbi:hypothetical protein M0R72_01555 [Candidatus Pacearchaeota archaeon]|jgi:hypothetical protein|nr:hypothetical protein [Candidatus Pacearchaeota archaeon]
MGWRDLLETEGNSITLPWTGGRSLCLNGQVWNIENRLPIEHGWYSFVISGRKATRYEISAAGANPNILTNIVTGYLVGNRLVPDDARVDPDPKTIAANSEQVFLVDDGLDRFARVSAGRTCDDGPLIFRQQEMPLGPEDEVLQAFFEDSLNIYQCRDIKGVVPALDAAFRMEIWQKIEAERRRQELERLRREEEERRAREERRQALIANLGNAETRRELAKIDFGEAARAALAVGNAQYLDHRKAPRRGEMVVRYRLDRRRFECVCDERTLRIIDAGICLTSHTTGVKGDTLFTLESLPSVVSEAIREDVLVVYRHVD